MVHCSTTRFHENFRAKNSRRTRVFVVKASRAYLEPAMNTKALSAYGRLDVVARSAMAALTVRAGIRRNTLFYAALEGGSKPLVLELDGVNLDAKLESEADFGELARRAIQGAPPKGVAIYEASFEELVSSLLKTYGRERTYYLHELGLDISRVRLEEDSVFILGDHTGVDPQTERWLKSQGVTWLSLGPTPYFTEHCITFIHAVLDGYITP